MLSVLLARAFDHIKQLAPAVLRAKGKEVPDWCFANAFSNVGISVDNDKCSSHCCKSAVSPNSRRPCKANNARLASATARFIVASGEDSALTPPGPPGLRFELLSPAPASCFEGFRQSNASCMAVIWALKTAPFEILVSSIKTWSPGAISGTLPPSSTALNKSCWLFACSFNCLAISSLCVLTWADKAFCSSASAIAFASSASRSR
mmetsp:Transcript_78724/g.174307  ORF Transcript_78724/g.174307 Transcript_78724/m.174307 type:complete len:206 (-) Transcript_78724:190-807(-)